MSEKTEKPVLTATVDVAGPRLEVPVAGWNHSSRTLQRICASSSRQS